MSEEELASRFPTQTFRLGEFWVDPCTGEVRLEGRSGKLVDTLPHKVVAVLVKLARTPGELVEKAALFEEVWGGRAVTDDVLTVAIYRLRKAFGDSPRKPRYVQTFAGRGYRLLVDVDWSPEPPQRSATAPRPARHRWLVAAAAAVFASVLAMGFYEVEFEPAHQELAVAGRVSLMVAPVATDVGDDDFRGELALALAEPLKANPALDSVYLAESPRSPQDLKLRASLTKPDGYRMLIRLENGAGREVWARRFYSPFDAFDRSRQWLISAAAEELGAVLRDGKEASGLLPGRTMEEVIEALFLGVGPLASGVPPPRSGWIGWPRGSRVKVVLSAGVSSEARERVSVAVEDLNRVLGDFVELILVQSELHEPELEDDSILIVNREPAAVAEQCNGSPSGCVHHIAHDETHIVGCAATQPDWFPGTSHVLFLGTCLGLHWLDSVALPNGLMTSIQRGGTVRFSETELEAIALVFASGLEPGVGREDFAKAGLISG